MCVCMGVGEGGSEEMCGREMTRGEGGRGEVCVGIKLRAASGNFS